MTFSSDILLRTLADLQGDHKVARYLVAFSGGLDSAVLLHALSQSREQHAVPGVPIVAVHVDHGLHRDSAAWEQHCRRTARSLKVDYVSRQVTVEARGSGIEAAARKSRYAVLQSLMAENDVVLSAHHEEDQGETLLLNLMRGSGLAGLAGIGARRAFGPGLLIRPLLRVSRRNLETYAREAGLQWLDDPANLDPRFDRNYLRQEILPRLSTRWPAVSARLRRSAELAAESIVLQDDLARLDLESLTAGSAVADRLAIPRLRLLSAPRQRNVLRYAIKHCGLPAPPATRLAQILTELLPARADAQPLVRWPGAEARRYRQNLYLLPEVASAPDGSAPLQNLLSPATPVELGRAGNLALGVLQLESGASAGIDPEVAEAGLQVRYRRGGEKIRPLPGVDDGARRATRTLKKLLQEEGVVPWLRPWIPLVYAGDTLVAVADLWIAEECASEQGFVLRWRRKPQIY